MSSRLRHRLPRALALPLAAAVVSGAHAQSHDVVTSIQTVVTSADPALAAQAGKDFAAQGLPTTTTTTTSSDTGTTWTITATRTGTITQAQVDAATAWCQRLHGTISRGTASTCTTTIAHAIR